METAQSFASIGYEFEMENYFFLLTSQIKKTSASLFLKKKLGGNWMECFESKSYAKLIKQISLEVE